MVKERSARCPCFLDRAEQVVPRCLEFGDALILGGPHHVVVANAQVLQVSEDLPGRVAGAVHSVTVQLTVALMAARAWNRAGHHA